MCYSLLQWNSFFRIVEPLSHYGNHPDHSFYWRGSRYWFHVGLIVLRLSYLKSNFGKQQKCFPINIHVDFYDPLFLRWYTDMAKILSIWRKTQNNQSITTGCQWHECCKLYLHLVAILLIIFPSFPSSWESIKYLIHVMLISWIPNWFCNLKCGCKYLHGWNTADSAKTLSNQSNNF